MTDLAIALLEHFKKNSGKRYKCYQLTRIFKVTTREIHLAIQGLPVRSSVEAKDRVWYFETEEDRAKVATKPMLHTMKKPKRDNRAMQMAISRCKEVYPNGGNFKSIS